MGQCRYPFKYWQRHRVMALGTNSPIPSPDNLTGLNFPSSRGFSFVPFPPISETQGDASLTIEPLIPTMPAPLKLEDPVTELPSTIFPLVPAKIE